MSDHKAPDSVCDNFLEIPFATGLCVPERLDKLQEAGDSLMNATYNGLSGGTNPYVGLKRAIALAHEPSLEVISRGSRHTRKTAEAVLSNLQDMSSFVVHHNMTATDRQIGVASELGVIGVAWWGIANGLMAEDSYVVPATFEQDRGSLVGKRNGFDFSLRIGGRKPRKLPVQVKTRINDKDMGYDESIPVVSPAGLENEHNLGKQRPSVIKLLYILADNVSDELELRSMRLSKKIQEARK